MDWVHFNLFSSGYISIPALTYSSARLRVNTKKEKVD